MLRRTVGSLEAALENFAGEVSVADRFFFTFHHAASYSEVTLSLFANWSLCLANCYCTIARIRPSAINVYSVKHVLRS